MLARVRVLVPLAVALLSTPAAAQTQTSETNRQIAETLFEQGRALMEQKKYAEACPKLAESQRLDPGGGTLLNLALCHELDGKTATAQSEFKEALGQAARDNRADREELAKEHLAALEKRVIRIQVVVPKSDITITLDGSRLAPAAWGVAIAVDPGEHRVVAEAESASRWQSIVDAKEEGRTYRVEVPALERAIEPPPTLSRSTQVEHVRPKAFGWLLGGGAVVFAGGVVTGIAAVVNDQYIDDHCLAARDFCRVDDAGAAANRATAFAWVSTVALTLGAAAMITAFILPKETRITPVGVTAKF